VDVAPVKGRLRPVLFVDAGQAGGAESLLSGKVLAGAGVGLSMFGGLLRFDLSHSLAPDDPGLRFDIAIQQPR
jgi:hemolysin activation/secretion protein